MNKTLTDNSANLINVLPMCIFMSEMDTINISMGYRYIPWATLVADEPQVFPVHKGTKLKLLIGSYVYATMLKVLKFMDEFCLNKFIYTIIDEHAECLHDKYNLIINLLLGFLKKDCVKNVLHNTNSFVEDVKPKIKNCTYNKNDESHFFYAKCYLGLKANSIRNKKHCQKVTQTLYR